MEAHVSRFANKTKGRKEGIGIYRRKRGLLLEASSCVAERVWFRLAWVLLQRGKGKGWAVPMRLFRVGETRRDTRENTAKEDATLDLCFKLLIIREAEGKLTGSRLF